MMISFKIILGVLFGLLVIAVTFLGVVSYQYNERVVATSSAVDHIQVVIDKANEIASLYRDLQLESNAVIIIGDTSLASGYRKARRALFVNLDTLRSLVHDDFYQIERIDTLEEIIHQLAGFTNVVLIQGSALPALAMDRRFEQGRELRMKLHGIIGDFINTERILLKEGSLINQQNISLFRRTFLELLAGIALLLATTFLLIRHNFNKRIRVEKELVNAKELFEKVFYESPTAIVISERESGKILNSNKASCQLLNYSKGELAGRSPAELQIFEGSKQAIDRDGQSMAASRYVERYINPRGKDPLWVSIHTQPVHLYDKDCLLTVYTDLSTHKRAEDDIKRALATEMELNKLKSNFVTLASHEFRTPLTTIMSSSFLLEKYTSPDNKEKVAKHLSRIKSSVNTLISILDEFLSITKIEEGEIVLNMEQLDLKEYLETLCQELQGFAKPGQNITYHHTGERMIYTDPVLLGNIVTNLLSNAIKYSPVNSPINVYSTGNRNVHVTVKDDGIGISEEDQKHLFKRFYRGSNAGNIQGTGLGLHIMKHYVDKLNGSVKLKSGLGKGTEIEIIFPSSPALRSPVGRDASAPLPAM